MTEQNGNMEDHTGVTAHQVDETTTGTTPGLLGKGKAKAVDPVPDVEMGYDEEDGDDEEDEGEEDEVSSNQCYHYEWFADIYLLGWRR
jgi:hypothetical protein